MVSMHPATVEEALRVMAESGAPPVAGGTDWMVGRAPASSAVFLRNIPVLREVAETDEGIAIGACCTFAQLYADARVPQLLRDAVRDIASPAIRNRGTIGGNIVNASPAGDTLPALYLLGARLCLRSAQGERVVPIQSFITGVKQTILQPGELLCQVILPPLEGVFRFEKVGARRAQAISKCSFAGFMRTEDGMVRDFRAAFGAVGKTVLRSEAVEQTLVGLPAREAYALRGNLRNAYASLLKPIDDQRSTAAYRRTVCLNLLGAFCEECLSPDNIIREG